MIIKLNFLDILALEDQTDALFWNVGNEAPVYYMQAEKRTPQN